MASHLTAESHTTVAAEATKDAPSDTELLIALLERCSQYGEAATTSNTKAADSTSIAPDLLDGTREPTRSIAPLLQKRGSFVDRGGVHILQEALRRTFEGGPAHDGTEASLRSFVANFMDLASAPRTGATPTAVGDIQHRLRRSHFDAATSRWISDTFTQIDRPPTADSSVPNNSMHLLRASQTPRQVLASTEAVEALLANWNVEWLDVDSLDFDAMHAWELALARAEAEERSPPPAAELFATICANVIARYELAHSESVLNVAQLMPFLRAMGAQYRTDVPFHNAIHAADVTHTLHIFMLTNKSYAHFTDEEILTLFIAACSHDAAHMGLTNAYLCAVRHPLTRVYPNNAAPLETLHTTVAQALLDEFPIFKHDGHAVRSLVASLIDGTNMQHHEGMVRMVRRLTLEGQLFNDDAEPLLRVMLHAADIGNPLKAFERYKRWFESITAEFLLLGNKERVAGLTLTLSEEPRQWVALQFGFVSIVVQPLMASLEAIIPKLWLDRLAFNVDTLHRALDYPNIIGEYEVNIHRIYTAFQYAQLQRFAPAPVGATMAQICGELVDVAGLGKTHTVGTGVTLPHVPTRPEEERSVWWETHNSTPAWMALIYERMRLLPSRGGEPLSRLAVLEARQGFANGVATLVQTVMACAPIHEQRMVGRTVFRDESVPIQRRLGTTGYASLYTGWWLTEATDEAAHPMSPLATVRAMCGLFESMLLPLSPQGTTKGLGNTLYSLALVRAGSPTGEGSALGATQSTIVQLDRTTTTAVYAPRMDRSHDGPLWRDHPRIPPQRVPPLAAVRARASSSDVDEDDEPYFDPRPVSSEPASSRPPAVAENRARPTVPDFSPRSDGTPLATAIPEVYGRLHSNASEAPRLPNTPPDTASLSNSPQHSPKRRRRVTSGQRLAHSPQAVELQHTQDSMPSMENETLHASPSHPVASPVLSVMQANTVEHLAEEGCPVPTVYIIASRAASAAASLQERHLSPARTGHSGMHPH